MIDCWFLIPLSALYAISCMEVSLYRFYIDKRSWSAEREPLGQENWQSLSIKIESKVCAMFLDCNLNVTCKCNKFIKNAIRIYITFTLIIQIIDLFTILNDFPRAISSKTHIQGLDTTLWKKFKISNVIPVWYISLFMLLFIF